MIDVLLGIVTYNNANIIAETINAVLLHTKNLDYMIVIYDNNSTDDTVKVIAESFSERMQIINSKQNNGFGYGHNQIFKQFEAKYYVVCNPDLIVQNNILRDLFQYMEKNRDVGMVTPKIVFPDGETQHLCKEEPNVMDMFARRFASGILKRLLHERSNKYEMRYTGYNKEFVVPYATGCFMFFRGEILNKIKGFDENFFMYLEDADITKRTNEISRVIFYPYNSVVHFWQRGSHNSLHLTLVNIKSMFYYFSKWGWKFR